MVFKSLYLYPFIFFYLQKVLFNLFLLLDIAYALIQYCFTIYNAHPHLSHPQTKQILRGPPSQPPLPIIILERIQPVTCYWA